MNLTPGHHHSAVQGARWAPAPVTPAQHLCVQSPAREPVAGTSCRRKLSAACAEIWLLSFTEPGPEPGPESGFPGPILGPQVQLCFQHRLSEQAAGPVTVCPRALRCHSPASLSTSAQRLTPERHHNLFTQFSS